MDVKLPDGTIIRNVPEGVTKSQLMARVGKLPTAQQEAESRLKPVAAERYAAEDAARVEENKAAPWYERFGTGVKTQAGRTMLGVTELANNLTGDSLFDPEVLAEAQREAERRDKGTGAAGFVGNMVGDFRNYVPVGKGAQAAAKARTLGQAAKQSAKIGAVSGALTGLTEGTGDADSSVGTNLLNAAVGTATGAGIGAALPVGATGVKKGLDVAKGTANRALAFAGSDAAAERVAYGNVANLLKGQGYTAGEVAGILDEFKAQGIDGGTLGQILQSSDLLAREKNLLQGGGEAGRTMGAKLREQPKLIADSILAKVNEYAQPEQTSYLYKQAAELADSPTSRLHNSNPGSPGGSATQAELPNTIAAIEDDLATLGKELPQTALKKIQRIISMSKQDGGFETYDKAKQMLADMYKENSTTTEQDTINEVVTRYRKMLNDSLEAAGGDMYKSAKQSSMRDMAMRDVSDAVTGANGMSVKTALTKFFGSIDKQEEFRRKLPEAARAEWDAYLANLEKVSGKFGGSDTASNTATQGAMTAETGLGFDANLNPLKMLDRATAPLQRRVRKAQAGVTFDPDTERLAKAMRKGEFGYSAPAALPRVLATEAAKAETDPKPAQITIRPDPELPPVDLPQIAPQSSAQPSLIDRFAQAESGGDPNAKSATSSASGLLGFTNDTWAQMVAKHGKRTGITLKDKNDPQAQMVMGELLAKENGSQLTKALGREPSEGELYIAHFLGGGDATKLIKSQGTRKQAVLLFPRKIINANRPIFFDKARPRTVEEVYALLESKVS